MKKISLFFRIIAIALLLFMVLQNNIYGLEGNNLYVIDNGEGKINEGKSWIYRPWESYSNAKFTIYNKIAISEDYPKEFQNIVIKQFGYISSKMTELGIDNCEDLYNYAEIVNMPTSYENGIVRLYYLTDDKEVRWEDILIKSGQLPKIKNKTELKGRILDDLVLIDIDEYNSKAPLNVNIAVEGKLQDDYLYDNTNENAIEDGVLKGLCYGREDIDCWKFLIEDTATKEIKEIKVDSRQKETNCNIELEIPYEAYKDLIDKDSMKIKIDFRAWIEVVFKDGNKIEVTDYVAAGFNSMNSVEIVIRDEYERPIRDKLQDIIEVEIEAPTEMFDVERFKIVDSTDYTNVDSRTVKIDGILLSEEDSEKFIAGDWLFDLKGMDDVYNYEICYTDKNRNKYTYKSYVKVYTVKPRVEILFKGEMKENRKIVAINNSKAVNSDYYNEKVGFEVVIFGINDQDKSKVNLGNCNKDAMEFSIVKPFEDVCIELKLKTNIKGNLNERNDLPADYLFSNEYSKCIQVMPDYSPSVVFNILNSNYVRNNELKLFYEAISLDGDEIVEEIISVYFDENDDNIFSKILYKGDIQGLEDFVFEKLGNYKLTAEVYEKEIDKAHIIAGSDGEHKRARTYVEKIISVENLMPFTRIYVETPNNYPEIDIFYVFDSKYSQEKSDAIIESNIEVINVSHKEQLNVDIQVWELNGIGKEKEINISKNTLQEYPKTSIEFNDNGYIGILELYNVENNKYMGDYWEKIIVEKSKYVEEFGTGKSWKKYVKNVRVDGGSTDTPTINYNKDGYSGTLYKKSWKVTSVDDGRDAEGTGTVSVYYSALYGGTVSGFIQEKVKKYGEINNYTGYYKGQVTKKYNTDFIPEFRDTSDRYIVYFCEDSINNNKNLDSIKIIGDCKVILVGNHSVDVNDIEADYFIDNGKTVAEINEEIVKSLNDMREKESGIVMLVNDRISLKYEDYDVENDEISELGAQVVHYPAYYDNEEGQESNTYLVFKESAYEKIQMPTRFNKPGKYEIYRKIADVPAGYEDKSKANESKIIVLVHRKPIANCEAEFSYDAEDKIYNISWVDNSYDLDFQYRDPEGKKGIRQQKMKYRVVGEENWTYSTPYKLEPGEYEVVYYVKDNYNAWSEPFYYSLNLPLYLPPTVDNLRVYTFGNSEYIYENDDVSFSMDIVFNSAETVSVKGELYSKNNNVNPVTTFEENVEALDSESKQLKVKVIDDIVLGDYILKIDVDDGQSVISKEVEIKANDLWINGEVGHTENWENNRQLFNEKYPDKPRDDKTYWNGEAFVIKSETTTIHPKSSVKCTRVTVEVLDDDNPNDEKYLKILDRNAESNKWNINYFDKGWISKNGYAIIKWGETEKKELTLKLTAYFNNDWIETNEINVFVDNTTEFWRLRRYW